MARDRRSINYSCVDRTKKRLFLGARGAMMNGTQGKTLIYVAALSFLAACTSQPSRLDIPAHAVVGVTDEQLRPEFWIARDSQSKKVVLDSQAIASQNARLLE